MPDSTPLDLLTVEQLAAQLQIPSSTIYQWRYLNQGPPGPGSTRFGPKNAKCATEGTGMSFELMQAFLRCDWPKGDGHTGQMRIAKVLGLYAELAEHGEAWPSQSYVAKELGLPLRDVQNAIKVLKSVGHLLKISGHETGERGITYRVTIPIAGSNQPDLPLPKLVDTKVRPDTHGDLNGDVPGTSNGALPGDVP
eukprot:gene17754-biopygen11959